MPRRVINPCAEIRRQIKDTREEIPRLENAVARLDDKIAALHGEPDTDPEYFESLLRERAQAQAAVEAEKVGLETLKKDYALFCAD